MDDNNTITNGLLGAKNPQTKVELSSRLIQALATPDINVGIENFTSLLRNESSTFMEVGGLVTVLYACMFYAVSTGTLAAAPIIAGVVTAAWAVIVQIKNVTSPNPDTPTYSANFRKAMVDLVDSKIEAHDSTRLTLLYGECVDQMKKLTAAIHDLRKYPNDEGKKNDVRTALSILDNNLGIVTKECKVSPIASIAIYTLLNTFRAFILRDVMIYGSTLWGIGESTMAIYSGILRDTCVKDAMEHVYNTYRQGLDRVAYANGNTGEVTEVNRQNQYRNRMIQSVFQYANLWDYIASTPVYNFVYPQRSYVLMSDIVGVPTNKNITDTTSDAYFNPGSEYIKREIMEKGLYLYRGIPHGLYSQMDPTGHYIANITMSYHEPTLYNTPDTYNTTNDASSFLGPLMGMPLFSGRKMQPISPLGNNITFTWNILPYSIEGPSGSGQKVTAYAGTHNNTDMKQKIYKMEGYNVHGVFALGTNQHKSLIQGSSIDCCGATWVLEEAFAPNFIYLPDPNNRSNRVTTILDACRANSSSTPTPIIDPERILPGYAAVILSVGEYVEYEVQYGGDGYLSPSNFYEFTLHIMLHNVPVAPLPNIQVTIESKTLDPVQIQPGNKIVQIPQVFRIGETTITKIRIAAVQNPSAAVANITLRSLIFVPVGR